MPVRRSMRGNFSKTDSDVEKIVIFSREGLERELIERWAGCFHGRAVRETEMWATGTGWPQHGVPVRRAAMSVRQDDGGRQRRASRSRFRRAAASGQKCPLLLFCPPLSVPTTWRSTAGVLLRLDRRSANKMVQSGIRRAGS